MSSAHSTEEVGHAASELLLAFSEGDALDVLGGIVRAKIHPVRDRTAQPGSGLVRSTAMRDQKDPSRVYMLAVFESEEHARAREGDPKRQEGLTQARATMAEIFDGAPEFVDLTVVEETAG